MKAVKIRVLLSRLLTKMINLYFKLTDKDDESNLDDKDIALINKNFKKVINKWINYGNKYTPTKDKNIVKVHNGWCHKCYKIEVQFNDCSLWKVEWKAEWINKRAQKEKRELATKRIGKERENIKSMHAGGEHVLIRLTRTTTLHRWQ